jgi:hypothetical protein
MVIPLRTCAAQFSAAAVSSVHVLHIVGLEEKAGSGERVGLVVVIAD